MRLSRAVLTIAFALLGSAAAIGDDALGGCGSIQRSSDGGHTWETPLLPIAPNTHMECFATHPADPDLILACSHYGQLFASSDGGEWWVIAGARLSIDQRSASFV